MMNPNSAAAAAAASIASIPAINPYAAYGLNIGNIGNIPTLYQPLIMQNAMNPLAGQHSALNIPVSAAQNPNMRYDM